MHTRRLLKSYKHVVQKNIFFYFFVQQTFFVDVGVRRTDRHSVDTNPHKKLTLHIQSNIVHYASVLRVVVVVAHLITQVQHPLCMVHNAVCSQTHEVLCMHWLIVVWQFHIMCMCMCMCGGIPYTSQYHHTKI